VRRSAGLPKPEFLAAKLADYGIDNFGQSSADLADEAANV